MTVHPPRPSTRTRGFALALFGACSACSVADNLTYPEIAADLDSIVSVEGDGASRQVRYAEHAKVSAWYLTSLLTQPLRWPLAVAFGSQRETELENPAGNVRELLREVPDEVGSDLDYGSDAIARALVLLELDSGLGVQAAALEVLCRVTEQLGLPAFSGDLSTFGASPDPIRLATARATLQSARPDRRNGQDLDASRAANYREALTNLAERALPTWADRMTLIGELAVAWRTEDDRSLRATAEQSLRMACGHAVAATLVRIVQDRNPGSADLRVLAMQRIRRLGGPRVVPLLLAVMAASSAEVRSGHPRYDQDPQVQLCLVHFCGQLRGELALQALRLPGRDDWEPITPADFLAWSILNDTSLFAKIRTPALWGLALALDRPKFVNEIGWVSEWYRDRQRKT